MAAKKKARTICFDKKGSVIRKKIEELVIFIRYSSPCYPRGRRGQIKLKELSQ
jgi:hypothetical protein